MVSSTSVRLVKKICNEFKVWSLRLSTQSPITTGYKSAAAVASIEWLYVRHKCKYEQIEKPENPKYDVKVNKYYSKLIARCSLSLVRSILS